MCLLVTRTIALVCLVVLLIASFAAPIHKHHADEDAACLICHVAPTAAAIASAAGAVGPRVTAECALCAGQPPRVIFSLSQSVRTPRAPPQRSFTI